MGNIERWWLVDGEQGSDFGTDETFANAARERGDFVDGPFVREHHLQGAVKTCREAAELLRPLIGADAETLRLAFTEGNDVDSLAADLDVAGGQ